MSWEFKLPEGWSLNQRWGDGYACLQKNGGLRVIVDCAAILENNFNALEDEVNHS